MFLKDNMEIGGLVYSFLRSYKLFYIHIYTRGGPRERLRLGAESAEGEREEEGEEY